MANDEVIYEYEDFLREFEEKGWTNPMSREDFEAGRQKNGQTKKIEEAFLVVPTRNRGKVVPTLSSHITSRDTAIRKKRIPCNTQRVRPKSSTQDYA